MQEIKQHASVKLLATILVMAVLLPAAVKFNHLFENHKHEVCENPQDTHFHYIDLDCEFYKFNLNTQYFTLSNYSQIYIEANYVKINQTFYNFLKNHCSLPFSLRGPPFTV